MTTNYQEIKYEFTPAAPEPGDDYDKWRERALNAMATSDERGWSLADHLLGIDEGGRHLRHGPLHSANWRRIMWKPILPAAVRMRGGVSER